MPAIEANKAIVRRYFETFNAGDFDRLGEILAQDYGDRLEGQAAGIEVIRSYLEGLKASFPDFTWTIEQIIAEGDRVAVLNRVTGTHLHDFGAMKATGNRVDFKAFQIYRIADGKLAEHWEVADFAKFQEQLSGKPKGTAFKQFQQKLKGSIKTYLLLFLGLVACSPTPGQDRDMHKKDVSLWYEAFNQKDSSLLDRILSEKWVDIPAAPGQPPGREGAKRLLVELTSAFPDLKIRIDEILQDGNKVTVRSEIAGTQREAFMGFPASNRTMTIQAIDIHEFKDGRIVRTWHTEDWLTGLHQLGVLKE